MSAQALCYYARAAIIKHHQLAGLNNRSLLSRSSEGWKSENKVLAGLAPSVGCEEKPVPGLGS